MTKSTSKDAPPRRCAIYTRKSSDEGLEQEFNSLHAQRESCEAYIQSQRNEGWLTSPEVYDDGGYSGGTMERPALTRLIKDIEQGLVDVIVVYKVDRLSRSLADFVRLVELFDQNNVSFVSVTQQFNTSSSMGRLTLNVLLSFAQFEREVTGERIRDKIAASKRKGMWMGGRVPLGYDAIDKALVVNRQEARMVRHIYERYLMLGCVRILKAELDAAGMVRKQRGSNERISDGKPFSRGALYSVLKNPVYIGKIAHRGELHHARHKAIIDEPLWQQVQDLLARNQRKKALRTVAKDPSLLAGLLYDSGGNPMSPSHSRKASRRYRYYVSQAVMQYRDRDAGDITRLPAPAIEGVVVKRLMELLRTPMELLDLVNHDDLSARQRQDLIAHGKALNDDWAQLNPAEQIVYLKKAISAVTVTRRCVDIAFSRTGLLSMLMESESDVATLDNVTEDEYRVSVPVHLKRCGIETRFVIPHNDTAPAHHSSIQAIQEALVKALNWNETLMCSTVPSMNALAKREGVTQRYIAHLLKLAYLAPDIMEAITRGDIPSSISLDRLKKGFPLDWEEQRKMLGFSA